MGLTKHFWCQIIYSFPNPHILSIASTPVLWARSAAFRSEYQIVVGISLLMMCYKRTCFHVKLHQIVSNLQNQKLLGPRRSIRTFFPNSAKGTQTKTYIVFLLTNVPNLLCVSRFPVFISDIQHLQNFNSMQSISWPHSLKTKLCGWSPWENQNKSENGYGAIHHQ